MLLFIKTIFIDFKHDQYAKRMKTNTSFFEFRIENHQFIMTVLKTDFLFMLFLDELNFDQNE